MNDKKLFSERLKQIRKLKKISQTDLGKLIGASYGQIQHYESGRSLPPYEKIKKLSDILNVPVGYFFGEYEIIDGKLHPADDMFFGEPYYIDDSIHAKMERLEQLIQKHGDIFLDELLDFAEYKHAQLEKQNKK